MKITKQSWTQLMDERDVFIMKKYHEYINEYSKMRHISTAIRTALLENRGFKPCQKHLEVRQIERIIEKFLGEK